jgi:steroid delta-isomerase-like uncharacterized protein
MESPTLIKSYLQAVEKADEATIRNCFWRDCVYHLPEPIAGVETFIEVIRHYKRAISNLRTIVEDIVIGEQKAAARYTILGLHSDIFAGCPATGRLINLSVFEMYHLSEGKIAELWRQEDLFGLVEQIGPSSGKSRPLGQPTLVGERKVK